MTLLSMGIEAVERGYVPDAVTRAAIRSLCRTRLRDPFQQQTGESADESFLRSLYDGPVAPLPDKANEQHYELPADFFELVLGTRRKYSCCYWPPEVGSLDEAEEAALEATCRRAELADGQNVLELGCGWGSLSIWMAEHFPGSRITAVSNSHVQRAFIQAEAAARGLENLRVVTADMNDFSPYRHAQSGDRFDRIVSVEMFEHMRNYELLLERIASWLRPEGKLFVHLFCHRDLAYPFETKGEADWMARHFFSGGMMPSAGLLHRFDRHLQIQRQWSWNGRHYQRTAEAWLGNLDARHDPVLELLDRHFGRGEGVRWLNRWRVFFLAVAELFGYDRGEEWFVSHYLFRHPQ